MTIIDQDGDEILSDEEIEDRVGDIMYMMADTTFTGEVMVIIYRFLQEYAQIVSTGTDEPPIHTQQEIIDLIQSYHEDLMNSLKK